MSGDVRIVREDLYLLGRDEKGVVRKMERVTVTTSLGLPVVEPIPRRTRQEVLA